MPMYVYHCDNCGETCEEPRPSERRDEPAACVICGADMHRDPLAEMVTQSVQTDPDACGDDYDQNIADRRMGRQVRNNLLSNSLSKVPGVPKVRGRDGKVYAAFRNQKHRAKTLAKLGIEAD